jgi:hypothetical protein
MLVDARVLVSQRTNLDRRLQQLEEKAEEVCSLKSCSDWWTGTCLYGGSSCRSVEVGC